MPIDLDTFLAEYAADDNAYWRLEEGEMQNAFDALLERYVELGRALDAHSDAVDFTDGRWVAMTLGMFVQVLIDGGADHEAILFRVLQPDKPVNDKSFIRQYHVIQVPNGSVRDAINALHCEAVHKILRQFLDGGLVA